MDLQWTTLCRRTDDPKLAYIETRLTEQQIPHRRNGESWHASILEVLARDYARADAVLLTPIDNDSGQTLDDISDDASIFGDEYQPHDWPTAGWWAQWAAAAWGDGYGPSPDPPALPYGY